MVLDLLHGRLGVEGVLDRAELVHAREVGHGFAGVPGRTGKTQGLGRWKVTEVRTLRAECDWVPLSAAFFAALALASWGFAAPEESAIV